MRIEFRTLEADEIEVRVATVSAKGCSLLLYKNARCDMNILDETVGSTNWQRHHSRDNANCIISIWDEDKKQWIEKEDTGTENFTEKEKSICSDSFKRAGVNWGIGRELYTAPFIWIPAEKTTIEKNNKDKWEVKDSFFVERISYDDKRRINGLAIRNRANNRVFVFVKESENKKEKKENK